MGLQTKLIQYLTKIRKDAHEPERIDRLKALVKTKHIEETHTHYMKIGGFINQLFHYMPEIKSADPFHKKLSALQAYGETLPKIKPAPKTR